VLTGRQSATALGKLGHPDGELNLTRAAAKHGVIQMVRSLSPVGLLAQQAHPVRRRQIPTLASCSLDDITGAAAPGQPQWFQLYVNRDRDVTRRLVQRAAERGAKALFITVDAPQLGRREKDMRQKFDAEQPAEQQSAGKAGGSDERSQGAARAISVRLRTCRLCWRVRLTSTPARRRSSTPA
jgi:L-lactate dehydrogenase (cytochrome)